MDADAFLQGGVENPRIAKCAEIAVEQIKAARLIVDAHAKTIGKADAATILAVAQLIATTYVGRAMKADKPEKSTTSAPRAMT